MTTKKAILYVRVSTDEQAEKGHSLAHQEEMLRKYCLMNQIEIVGFFREDHSAKTFERPEFNKLLEAIKKNKNLANLLLFLKWDRFSRNAPEAYTMINQLNKLGVEPQAIEQPLNLEIPEQKFLLALYLTAPEVENDRRALNIIAGIRKAMKEGRYMGTAPYGYKHARNAQNKPCIIPNPDHIKMVQTCFEMMATGNYTIEELRKKLNKKGMPLGRNRFWVMLRNPIYIAKVYIPAYKNEVATMVQANHEAIITESLFYEVQDILEGRKRVLPASPHCQHEELPLRGYLTCSQCGKRLTGSASKGRSARYYYYHCKNECKERIKANEAHDEFNKMLLKVSSNNKMLQSLELIMTDANKKNKQSKVDDLAKTKKELETIQKRLDHAQTLMLDGQLDAGEYRTIKSKLEPEIERLAVKILSMGGKSSNHIEMIKYGFYFLKNLDKLFKEADLSKKRQILGSTFPEKLVFKDGQYRTEDSENVILRIASSSKGYKEKREADKKNFIVASRRVELRLQKSNFLIADLLLLDMFS